MPRRRQRRQRRFLLIYQVGRSRDQPPLNRCHLGHLQLHIMPHGQGQLPHNLHIRFLITGQFARRQRLLKLPQPPRQAHAQLPHPLRPAPRRFEHYPHPIKRARGQSCTIDFQVTTKLLHLGLSPCVRRRQTHQPLVNRLCLFPNQHPDRTQGRLILLRRRTRLRPISPSRHGQRPLGKLLPDGNPQRPLSRQPLLPRLALPQPLLS